jgi:outer membrane protein
MSTRILQAIILFMLLPVAQASNTVIRINLDKAIELAYGYDARIDEKKAFVRKAEAVLAEAEGSEGFQYGATSFLAITRGLEGGFYEGGAESCSDNCRPRDDNYDLEDGLSFWAGLSFSIIKPLMTFGRLENYQLAAQKNILVKQQEVILQRDIIRLDVVKAYYGYLTARDSRFLLEDTRKRLEGALQTANDWIDRGKGNVSLSDRYALESGMGLISSYLANARGVEAIALEGLKLLTGMQEELLEVEDKRLEALGLPDQNVDKWIEHALVNRVEFRQVEAGLSARRALVEAQRAGKKPVVFAGVAGTLTYAPGRDRLDNPHIYDPFNNVAVSPLIGMRWQFGNETQSALVSQAQADLDVLVHKASFAQRGIPFQVREQFLLVQSRYESIQAMKSSAKSARRWMISSYSDFEAGLEEPKEILEAMRAYVFAYADYLKVVNDFNNHVFKLKSVSGHYR